MACVPVGLLSQVTRERFFSSCWFLLSADPNAACSIIHGKEPCTDRTAASAMGGFSEGQAGSLGWLFGDHRMSDTEKHMIKC